MQEGLRVCKKCLLREISEEKYFADLERYIKDLDPDVRVDQATYEERLTICGKCDKQLNGMCRLCGCYVELRAALKVRKCPDLPPRWNADISSVSENKTS